jgi:hypothetical protein
MKKKHNNNNKIKFATFIFEILPPFFFFIKLLHKIWKLSNHFLNSTPLNFLRVLSSTWPSGHVISNKKKRRVRII